MPALARNEGEISLDLKDVDRAVAFGELVTKINLRDDVQIVLDWRVDATEFLKKLELTEVSDSFALDALTAGTDLLWEFRGNKLVVYRSPFKTKSYKLDGHLLNEAKKTDSASDFIYNRIRDFGIRLKNKENIKIRFGEDLALVQIETNLSKHEELEIFFRFNNRRFVVSKKGDE